VLTRSARFPSRTTGCYDRRHPMWESALAVGMRAGILTIMHRWTARFLLLVMLVPAFGSIALARAIPSGPMHCLRRPVRADARAVASAEPQMHCHGGAAQARSQSASSQNAESPSAVAPASPPASFRSSDGCCCQNHGCCGSLKTSEWASIAYADLSSIRLLVESAHASPGSILESANLTGFDSARAPPQ
jgi:hypothetical protein